MKRCVLLCLLLLAVPLLLAPAAFAEQRQVTIGVTIPTADHGWTGGIVWWAEKAISELKSSHPDLNIIYSQAQNYVEQNYAVEEMLQKGIDALVILPHNPPHLANVLRKAHATGAFIVIVDRTAPTLVGDIYIAADNYRFGQLCGQALVATGGNRGKLVVMEGISSEVNTLRVKGFREVLAGYPNITVLDSQPANWSRERGFELMQYYLDAFDQIDMVWCGDDDVLLGALDAYRRSGRQDVRLMLGGGGSKEVVKLIMDNNRLVPATVTYPPSIIYDGIKMAVGHLLEGKVYPTRVTIPSELVTEENAKAYFYPDSIY